MNEEATEIYRALRESQNKYTYFLLAAAGAAIALTVSQTREAHLVWSQVPLALGALSWALSFLFGCRHVKYVNSALYANYGYLQVASGQHPLSGTDPQRIAIGKEVIHDAMEHKAKCANRNSHRQFTFLVAGAVFYVVWHVLEMYLRGVCST